MTSARQSLLVPALLVVFLCALMTSGDIPICPRCGYENPEKSRLCVHCDAKLPESRSAEEPTKDSKDTPPLSGDSEYLDPEVVRNEAQMGRQYLLKEEVNAARLFFKNAATLDMLTDPRVENNRSNRILQFLEECETISERVKRKCPLCGGTGKGTMKVTSLKGETKYQEVYGKSCPKCRGRRYVLRPATIDEQKYATGRATRRFAMLQQGRKFVSVGGAWVPQEMVERLSIRQTVRLKRTAASPCHECMGIGRAQCRECNGTASIECPNRECDNGMIEVEVGGLLTRTKIKRTEKCKVCGGRALVACPKCGGKGSVLCKKCNGTGERPICRKCGGQGLIACRRCKGSGVYKRDVCPSCAGERVMMCSSCNGDGRKK